MAANYYRFNDIVETPRPQSRLKIVDELEDQIAIEGSDAEFECRIEGNPRPVVFWHKDGQPITSNQRNKIVTDGQWYRLEITNVMFEDVGVYTLICNQFLTRACLFIVPKRLNDAVVYMRPLGKKCAVTEHIRDIQVKIGGTIELEADFDEEIQDYRWFKNDEPVYPNERTMILKSNKTSHLSILRAVPTDTGIFYLIARTRHGLVSSLGNVLVLIYSNLIQDENFPMIEEMLPDEVEISEGEETRLVCKANLNIRTSIKWTKNREPIDKVLYTPEEYGSQYIGLKFSSTSRTDTAEYTVLLQEHRSGKIVTSSCYLRVVPAPSASVPPVEVKKSLEHVLACYGAKLTFDCSFALEDPMYFYVVWYLGRYSIERSNHRFEVICQGGHFLLYIKELEAGMAGDVTCELRRVLPNQRSIAVARTVGNLAIVPRHIIRKQSERYNALKPNLYDVTNAHGGIRITNTSFVGYQQLTNKANEDGACVYDRGSEIVLDITYCRLEEDGPYYVQASKGNNGAEVFHLLVYDKVEDAPQGGPITVIFEWEDSLPRNTTWYCIELEHNGIYLEAGHTSSPRFEVLNPPLGKFMKFRARIFKPISECTEASVCIKPKTGVIERPPKDLQMTLTEDVENHYKKTGNLIGSGAFGRVGQPNAEMIERPPKDHQLKIMEDFENHYKKTGNLIGSGAFGHVVLVNDNKGELYAAKIIKTRTQKRRDIAVREFETMKQLQHPKLVELIDAFVAKDSFIIVMDYLWGGELFERIVEEEHIKEADVVPYVRQICEALQYLHSLQIAHLDLKPENIICLSPNSGQVKIIDFGLARILEKGHMTRAIYGTRDYVAPEVLNYERLTLACDMWSLGVVTYMLLSGVMPFAGESWSERSANITRANYNYEDIAFHEISDYAKDFVDKLLLLKADERMSAKAALDHKWITEGPLKGFKTGHLKRTRENLKSYLANCRDRWQRAGNVMIAVRRLRTHAVGLRTLSTSATGSPRVT